MYILAIAHTLQDPARSYSVGRAVGSFSTPFTESIKLNTHTNMSAMTFLIFFMV